MDYDRTISNDAIRRAVRAIEPTWEVRDATPATAGHHVVYHLDVETGAGCRECVLKGTPPEKPAACGDEARLLAVLGAHTDLPVPEVYGVVDEREGLPTPLFLASTPPGANHDRTDLLEFSDATVERIARSTGRHLAALHELDVPRTGGSRERVEANASTNAVDAYGLVGVDADERLDGGRPSAALDQIIVEEPAGDWREYLRASADEAVAGLEATRFADLRSTVGPVLDERIDALSGEFDPVVARIDQSLDNSLLDPETGAVTGLLDWEFCVAATPAYDLAFVEHSLASGVWAAIPGVPDRRETIRPALLDGYLDAAERSSASPHSPSSREDAGRRDATSEPSVTEAPEDADDSRVVAQFRENYGCYALLAEVHAMLNFDGWFDQADVDDEQREAAEEPLRRRVERLVEQPPDPDLP